jgi:hypothetical protein
VGAGGNSGDEVFTRLGGVGLEVGFVHIQRGKKIRLAVFFSYEALAGRATR